MATAYANRAEWEAAQQQGQRQGAMQTTVELPTGSNWYMPVAGMKSAPGDYQSGAGNWQKGSFGYQKPASKGGHVHTGTDVYAEQGTAIVAPVAGTVISSGRGAQSGNYIKIRGTDGIEYYFAHMEAPSPWKSGARVQGGIYVGAVGKTGNASGTTAHLHFAMKKNGKAISPNAFLETGRQQKHTPLSAIPGLNTPAEIANWAMEESKRQAAGHQAMQEGGFDAASIPGRISEGQVVQEEGFGQRFLGATLDSFSRKVSGGQNRVSIPKISGDLAPSTSMEAVSPDSSTGVAQGKAEHPALAREEKLGVTDGS
jgi:hypothetical protein